jgi:sulfur-carrier protein
MNIKVLFFANFKELLKTGHLDFKLKPDSTVTDLCELLAQQGPAWESVFNDAQQKVKVSVNQEMADMNHRLQPEDEVAFFPPVTGG